MNILMILSNPFIVDPRVYKEATSLVQAGHKVTVIVWDRKQQYEPESIIDGVRIIRIHNKKLQRILPHDLFKNPLWWRTAYKKGLQLYQTDFQFDVVHCHDLETVQSGVWLKKKLGVKLVYDSHEIFGYMIERTMPKPVVNFAFNMEKKLIKHVDQIITVDDGYAQYFKDISKQYPLAIVRNCKDTIGSYKPPTRKEFTLIYIGSLTHQRFFPQILEVIGEIPEVKLVIGAKKEGLYEEIEALSKHYKNIEFLGTIPTDKVVPLTHECQAIICLFNPNDRLNKIGSPNKIFEAMVTGRPIIVTKHTNAGDIITKENCGLAIDYEKQALHDAIIYLKNNPNICKKLGENGINAAEHTYNWEKQKQTLLHIYETIKTD